MSHAGTAGGYFVVYAVSSGTCCGAKFGRGCSRAIIMKDSNVVVCLLYSIISAWSDYLPAGCAKTLLAAARGTADCGAHTVERELRGRGRCPLARTAMCSRECGAECIVKHIFLFLAHLFLRLQ